MTEYTRRQLRDITRLALQRLASGAGLAEPTADVRDRVRAALADLNNEARPDLREPYLVRFRVEPGVHLVVDVSRNILLEVRTQDEAELLAAYPLGNTREMEQQLQLCRIARDAAEEDSERERRQGQAARLRAQLRPGEDATP